ncbi:MAG: toprim domain-containing protein, partial [Proteobacteria bacterium]|nr:toprim domain-containing protein [Pseudomonadota bacterium]
EQLVVVEGYMDAVALARHGIDFVVATLGTATTAEHLNRLFRLTDNVCFAFDGDRAGRKAAWRALENALPLIREGRQVRFLFLPDGHDPDSFVNEFGTDAFLSALEEASALSEFLIEELAGQVDMSTVDGRARLAELARPLISRIPPGVYRELLLDSLAQAVGLTTAKLDKMLGSGPSGGPGGRAASGRTRPGSATRSGGHPSIVQHAVSLVLNHPASALEADVARLAGVARKGTDLLASLIETVQAEPNISTAGLVERYRHDEQGRYLGRLAAAELPADEDFDAATELADCLAQLELLGRKERIAFLIEKQRVNGLTDDEKAELQALLRAAQLDAVYIDSALP